MANVVMGSVSKSVEFPHQDGAFYQFSMVFETCAALLSSSCTHTADVKNGAVTQAS
jgi:hypothetical protein